jgi:hypothetical protein
MNLIGFAGMKQKKKVGYEKSPDCITLKPFFLFIDGAWSLRSLCPILERGTPKVKPAPVLWVYDPTKA